jgi:hypothetical protein
MQRSGEINLLFSAFRILFYPSHKFLSLNRDVSICLIIHVYLKSIRETMIFVMNKILGRYFPIRPREKMLGP